MSSYYKKTSLRDLRLSTASSLLATPSSVASLKQSRNFASAPKRTLALSNVKSNECVPTTDRATSRFHKKESRRARKKREWIRKQEQRRNNGHHERQSVRVPWENLPDLVLEKIFRMLPYESKLYVVVTCRNWRRVAMARSVWSDWTIHEYSMVTSRFNFAGKFYESRMSAGLVCTGWSKVLFLRSIWCTFEIRDETLQRAGLCRYKFNLYAREDQFAKDRGGYPDIESFTYVFPCDFARKSNEVDIYGTGGMILQDMKDLLYLLPGIKRLVLKDLELDGADAAHVLDEVSEVCATRLQQLYLVNTSRRPFCLLSVAAFVNLRVLIISPHNVGDDLVECLGDMPKLRNLQLMTNKYTECVATPVDYRVWKRCRKANPKLRVHLVTQGKHSKEHTFQNRAPVKSIVYETPYTRASTFSINLAVELYRTDLECYAHMMLPRFHMPRSFHDRPDSAYLYLARQCPYIHTLMIREKISSSTVLLLAYTAKNLRYFYVRKNAILLKCEWPKNPEWSIEFYKWLKTSSRNYDDMEREVSQILGFRWTALNDKQFKLTSLNLNISYYYEGFEEAS